MERLVYTPRVDAYIKADTGIYDISPYITQGRVSRKLDQVSQAEITIRNPDFMWTKHKSLNPVTHKEHVSPVFHPMDPITVTLTRLRNRPIQVLTGFLDQSPYLQLFPGTITLRASCTLKKLLYTYFDPGLPFFNEFLDQHGWEARTEGTAVTGVVNPTAEKALAKGEGALNDTGFGELLFAILQEIGGWEANNIYIENIPDNLIELVTALFQEAAIEGKQATSALEDLLHRIIGTASLGSGIPGGTTGGETIGGGGPPTGVVVTPVDVGRAMITVGFPGDVDVIAQGIGIVNGESGFGQNMHNPGGADGYWQILGAHPGLKHDCSGGTDRSCTRNLVKSTQVAYELWHYQGNTFAKDWTTYTAAIGNPWREKAQRAIQLGKFTRGTPAGGPRP